MEGLKFMTYILALGSNLSSRSENLACGRLALAKFGELAAASRVLETPPLQHADYDTADHGLYLNQLVRFRSPLAPWPLYLEIVKIEDSVGHDRSRRWAPRSLDIDILLRFAPDGSLAPFASDSLTIPHAALAKRWFWGCLLPEVSPLENQLPIHKRVRHPILQERAGVVDLQHTLEHH